MRAGGDDRAQRYCDIFSSMKEGDINCSIVYPGTLAAFHMHYAQDDYQIVLKGSLKIGICNVPNYSQAVYDLYRERYDNKTLDDFIKKTSDYSKIQRLKLVNQWFDFMNSDYFKQNKDLYSDFINGPVCKWFYLSDRNTNNGPVIVRRGLQHGSFNFTNEEAILLYFINNKYNGSDEYRASVDIMGWDWKRETK